MNSKQRQLCEKLKRQGILPEDTDCDSSSKRLKRKVIEYKDKRSSSKSPKKIKKKSLKSRNKKKSDSKLKLTSADRIELAKELNNANEVLLEIQSRLDTLIQSSKSSTEPVKISSRQFIANLPPDPSSSAASPALAEAAEKRRILLLKMEEEKQRYEEEQLKLKLKEQQLEAAKKAEEEKKRQQLEAAKKAEEEKKRQLAEAAKKAEEEKKRQQLEAAKKAEEEKRRQQLEAAKKAEEEKKRQLEATKKAEEEKQRQLAEATKKAEEEKKKQLEAAKKTQEDNQRQLAEATKKAEEEKQRQLAEAAKKTEEEKKRQLAEAAKKAEEEKKQQQLEIDKKAEEEKQKQLAEAAKKASEDKEIQAATRRARIEQLQQKWNALNINNIRSELKKRNITASGSKGEMISKLIESDLQTEAKSKTDQQGQIVPIKSISSSEEELEKKEAKELTSKYEEEAEMWKTTRTKTSSAEPKSLSETLQTSLATTKSLETALSEINQGKPVVTTPSSLLTSTTDGCDTLFNVKNASGNDCWFDSLLIALFGPKSDKIKRQFLDKNPKDLDIQVKEGKKFVEAPLATKTKLHNILIEANAIIHQDPESIEDKSGTQKVCNNLRVMLSKFKSYISASGFDDPSNAWNALQTIYNPTVMVLQKRDKIQGILPSRHQNNQINQAFVDSFKLKSAEFLSFYIDRQTTDSKQTWVNRDVEFSKTLTLPGGQVFTIASFVAYDGGKSKKTGASLPGHFVAYVRCGDQSWLKFDDLSGSSTPEKINGLPKENLSKESILVFYV